MKRPIWWSTFRAEYLTNGGNGTEAYLKARPGVKRNTARANADRLLTNAAFKVFLAEAQEKVEAKTDWTFEKWVRMLSEVAGFDVREFLVLEPGSGDVQLVPNWKEKAEGHAIEEVQFQTTTLESGQVVQRVKLKPASKLKALEMLGKALGYMRERVEHSGRISVIDLLYDDLKPKDPTTLLSAGVPRKGET